MADRKESDKEEETPKGIEQAEKGIHIQSPIHGDKSPRHIHHKETHGTSDDIDESTPIDEVKGPSVLERVKEEIEALVEAVHPKK